MSIISSLVGGGDAGPGIQAPPPLPSAPAPVTRNQPKAVQAGSNKRRRAAAGRSRSIATSSQGLSGGGSTKKTLLGT